MQLLTMVLIMYPRKDSNQLKYLVFKLIGMALNEGDVIHVD